LETYRIENLTFTYPNREKPALQNINLNIMQGEFVTLCGPSGCGKTTLLRQLKSSTSPHGVKSGGIYFRNTLLSELSAKDAASKIGFVFQSPDNQIVTDKVWHELAFGLESLGVKTPEIRLRVAEMASFFGIQTWFHKSVSELSGGQKQILALASVMALQPSVLILDEPTSQLDPIASGEFLATLSKINRELGVTIIITEHRLEEVLPISTRTIVMENGEVIVDGNPSEVAIKLREHGSSMFLAMPAPMRIWMSVAGGAYKINEVPITVRDGAQWLLSQTVDAQKTLKAEQINPRLLNTAIELNDVWFRYEKNLPDVVNGLSFKAYYGEIATILGGNGTGKTTTLSLIAGLYKPYRGKIHSDAKVYALPQNPQAIFVGKTVREDLLEILAERKLSKEEKSQKLAIITKLCHLEGLLDNHPYDLSGGEQQRAALAKVLLLKPKILLLDEPTKGLDAEYKQIFAAILRKLTEAGTAVVMVSHDIEFCAENSDKCFLFFDGSIVTEGTPREFFCGNSFYTTSANRMSRNILPEAITVSDVVLALGGKMPEAPEILDIDAKYEIDKEDVTQKPPKCTKLSKKRKTMLSVFSLLLITSIIFTLYNLHSLFAFISGGHESMYIAQNGASLYITIMIFFALSITGILLTLSWKREEKVKFNKKTKGKLSKRTIVAMVMIFFSIPITIISGVRFFDDRRFYFIAMLIILQTIFPFMLVFESRKPQAREILVIAVLCAIAVAGRSAFFMLPQFKPVVAIVIIAGVSFGGEAGFLVGTVTGFVSNMFLMQGPWTPWQMFAFGIIGFLAGVLFRKGLLSRSTGALAIFGGFATFVIYGGIMNPASVIMWQPNPTVEMFLLAYLQGIPFDLVHAVATVTFLAIIAKPMLEKLDRIKIKYGLVK